MTIWIECNRCGFGCEEQDAGTYFHANPGRLTPWHSRCKKCRLQLRNSSGRVDPNLRRNGQKRTSRERTSEKANRALWAEFIEDGCYSCQEIDPILLIAHHIRDKQGDISRMRRVNGPITLSKELEKCVPLCGHCHTRLHAGLLVLLKWQNNQLVPLDPTGQS